MASHAGILKFYRERSGGNDLEGGDHSHSIVHSFRLVALLQGLLRSNFRFLDELDGFLEGSETEYYRRQNDQQAAPVTAILPSAVRYGSQKTASSTCVKDCAICLEDFENGQWCHVLPVCNHMFHLNCIQRWLMESRTCPMCRSSIDRVFGCKKLVHATSETHSSDAVLQ
ncbi:hypothetical protein I3760_11G163000 [Carya illinoinensis]|nr:hypothetical protein I3760_11G163000 [Carya illinoinensis]